MSAKQATKIKAMKHGLTYDVAHPLGGSNITRAEMLIVLLRGV